MTKKLLYGLSLESSSSAGPNVHVSPKCKRNSSLLCRKKKSIVRLKVLQGIQINILNNERNSNL